MAYVPLTRGKTAVIDAADAHLVGGVNWCAVKFGDTFYAATNRRLDGKRRVAYAHRDLMTPPDDMIVDHIDGNGLNCRRSNMRLATRAQNVRNSRRPKHNTSGFKGVSYNRKNQRWQAHIKVDSKSTYLGLYATPEDAYAAYCVASERYHGKYGRIV